MFTSEQEMVRDTIRTFLADRAPMALVREIMETDSGFSDDLWRELADLGVLGIHIPEEFGGAGFTMVELGLVMEELGRTLAPVPFFSSAVLGTGALLLAGSQEQKAELLPLLASGELRLALAATEADGEWDIAAARTAVRSEGDQLMLSGTKSFVIDGHTAHQLIVTARDAAGDVSLYLVAGDAPEVTRMRLATMDMTRRLAEVSFDEAPAVRLGQRGVAPDVLMRLYDVAAAALAAEQLGGAQACLDASVEYAKIRYQFGRPIGSFQAIKHKCADMLVLVESAKSVAYHAAWAAANDLEELLVAAPLAKSYCSEAFFQISSENIQVHGGIGFTWEHDAHLFFKRAKSTQLLLGDPGLWRERLADRMSVAGY